MKRLFLVAGLILSLASAAPAQTQTDSAAVVRSVLSHFAALERPTTRIGLVQKAFVGTDEKMRTRGRSGDWRTTPSSTLAALAANNPRLTPIASMDSLPMKCEDRSFRGRTLNVCLYRDHDVVVGVSQPTVDGSSATAYLIEARNATQVFDRVGRSFRTVLVKLARQGSNWVVVSYTTLWQT